MDDMDKRVIIVGGADAPEVLAHLSREGQLAALYPDELRPMAGMTINFGPDPGILAADREAKRLARQAAQLRILTGETEPRQKTETDRARLAAAEAKRARRRARNTR